MTTTDQAKTAILHFPYSSIQFIADSNQCQHLSDESVKYLTLEATGVVRFLLQDALKFTRKCRRTKMITEDLESAMKMRHLEPIIGFRLSNGNLPFKTTTAAGTNHRDVHCIDDHELQLDQVITAPMPKIPLDVSIRTHWLAIEGKQPTVNENPEIISKADLTADSLDPMKSLTKKRYNLDASKIKTSNPHELSLEQQIYYKEITEACVGSEEQKRQEAIASLSTETGLHQILPRIVLFISEGVKVNLMQYNLAILIYLMRMTSALLENKSLYCEKYLHQLFPAIMSCILAKQLCPRPDTDNHWALRDYAASRCAQMVKMFSASIHGLRNRIVRIFLRTFHSERLPLVTHYGALVGLCEMGQEAIEELVFPIIRTLGDRIVKSHENPSLSSIDKITIERINNVISKYIPTAYRASRPSPDDPEHFKHEFGSYYGHRLYTHVTQLRQQSRSASQPTQNRQFSPSSSGPGSRSSKFLPGQSSPSSHHPNAGSITPSRSPARLTNPSLSKQHPQSSTVSLTPANSHENVIL
jgi:transcription initiation factor TFIID subunit 6